MGIWPPFPIILRNMVNFPMHEYYDFNAAIVHPNRVREINLFHLSRSQLQRLASSMQKQFPALMHLMLAIDVFHSQADWVLPNGFLGGSAPRLQSFTLDSIPFPALPKLLLSATDLVRLTLRNIPHSGYIPPETIVTSLAVLANLRFLTIEFEFPISRGGSRPRATSLTRTVLPTLTCLRFRGVSEYLEDLVARIDAPLLDNIWINFFHQLIFDIPQLAQFMERTTRFQALDEAHVDFEYCGVKVGYLPRTGNFDEKAVLRILCGEFSQQLSSLTQVSTSLFPRISMVEHLYIYQLRHLRSGWKDNIEIMQWLEIFRPFIAARSLYVSATFARCIAPTLQEFIGANLLPALERLFVEGLQPSGPIQEAIGQFVAARQFLGHPVAVSRWNRT
jgi:hypothetical protein